MKASIHPNYVESIVRCACGNEFTTRSTLPQMRVELCSKCHPFYTGEQRLVDTAGRVDRFNRRYAKAAAPKAPAEEAPTAEAPAARAPTRKAPAVKRAAK
ncbi:MAG: 50S ribosomal protein L31 [Dehalococcoidia bacterium]|nr:50S ribosomal protein L31 [Dehalococcoidia bacterium]